MSRWIQNEQVGSSERRILTLLEQKIERHVHGFLVFIPKEMTTRSPYDSKQELYYSGCSKNSRITTKVGVPILLHFQLYSNSSPICQYHRETERSPPTVNPQRIPLSVVILSFLPSLDYSYQSPTTSLLSLLPLPSQGNPAIPPSSNPNSHKSFSGFSLPSNMVQRKAPIKPVALTEPKRTHVKPESYLAQDTRSKGGGGDLKKKMKMIRSMKVSDLASLEVSAPAHKNSHFNEPSRPKGTSAIKKISDRSPNYMKPTSCWDARKEQMQVTIHSPTTTDKNMSPRNPRNLNHSKPSTSPAGSGLKPFKILSRRPSLKRAWPLIKKSSGVSLSPQKVVNRATCSSTLKDSKFPKALELSPGATEAKGTSVMRVCPYNYCSLNGHTHAPLPPLKSFMSARRALIKTHKSFKLKGLPSFRMKGLGKDVKEIDTGQKAISRTPSGLAIIPLIEEIANDFFVEIYVKPQEQTVELQNCDERKSPKEDDIQNPQVLDGSSINQDDDEGTKSEVDEESGRDALNQMDESYKDVGLEDDLDQKSDLSVEEIDDMMNSLEYVECDKQIEDEEDNHLSSVSEDYAEWCFECYIFDVLGKENKVLLESETMISISKGIDLDYEEIAEEGNTDDGKSGNNDASASSEENEQDDELTTGGTEPLSSEQNVSDLSFLGCKEEVSEEREESNEEVAFPGQDKNGIDIMKAETFESADMETNQHSDDESLNHIILSIGMKEEENGDDEVEATSSLLIIQLSESCQGSTEVDTDDFAEGDHIQTKLEAEECNCDDATEDQVITPEIHIPSIDQSYEDSRERNKDSSEKQQEEVNEIERSVIKDIKHDCNDVNEATQVEDDVDSDADDICLLPSNKSSKEDKIIDNARAKSNHPLTKAVDRSKARLRITRKRTTEESEQMKEFNPRPPNFLSVEPDPEAEKVDLRHQTTDERKNAEEWMVDYALQQAVSKLAPARKRKVALLVEAFETVMPLPMCEEPLRHTTSGFANARLQACS